MIKNREATANYTSAPSAYEYHVKTIAIIEGNPLLNVNELINSNSDTEFNTKSDHKIFKRSLNLTQTAGIQNGTKKSDELSTSSSVVQKNFTITNSSIPKKDLTKRHSYHPGQKYRKPKPQMTQAIMKDDEGETGSASRRSSYPVDNEHDIENFFRKNVPIYDGVPIARKGTFRNPEYKRNRHFSDDEEEEDDKGLLEVHPDHDSEYEYVPMMVDAFGKQKVMESDTEDDYEPPKYSYPPKYSSSYDDDRFQNVFSKPSDHPYRFESSYSPFKSHESDHSSIYSPFKSHESDHSSIYSPFKSHESDHSSIYSPFKSHESDHSDIFSSNPPKYGTSHQYNSLADDQPRYYKHFTPIIRNQASSDDEDHISYPFPSTNHYREQPRSPHFHSHDFIPKRASSFQPINKIARPTHVPQTLEEYHRIHGNFDAYKNKPSSGYNTHSSIIVPQDDKEEEEEEEKEESPLHGPKSFVSLSFGAGSSLDDDDDDGASIRHQVGHFRPKYSYFGGKPEPDDDTNVDYASESIRDNSGFKDPNSESIKSYVDSFFKQKDSSSDFLSKKSHPISPYNPHFGERVKQKVSPSQNILWHREATNDRASPRTRSTREKNDRHLHEENIRMFDNLVKDFKPSKRKTDKIGKVDLTDENAEENEPTEVIVKAKDENEDDKPHHTYWSQTISEPNK